MVSQFDILWSDLTGLEHLWLFAVIKGLPTDRIGEVKGETEGTN